MRAGWIRVGVAAIVAVAGFVLAAGVGSASATALRADPSFGKGGGVEPKIARGYDYTSFLSAEVGADGAIVTDRHGASSTEDGSTVRRYRGDGRLDRGFKAKNVEPEVKVVDAEGKTLVGDSNAIKRYLPDGRVDPSFGIEPGGERPFSDILRQTVEWIVPLPDGKILVGSVTRKPSNSEIEEITIARLDHAGRLDPSFGKGGEVNLTTELGVEAQGVVAVLAHGEDGAMVLLDEAPERLYEGQAIQAGGSIVLALGADGKPDPGYGNSGLVRSRSSIERYAQEPDGSLLLTGDAWGERIGKSKRRESDLYVERLTPAGRADPGFGKGGIATVDFGGLDLGEALLVDADGSILVGGSTIPLEDSLCLRFDGFCEETPVLARLRPDGAPDPAFGKGGKVRLGTLTEPFVSFGTGRGVRMANGLPGGDMLVGGGSGTAAFLAKVDRHGDLLKGFGQGGVVVERDRQELKMEPRIVGTDGRGRIYVAAATNSEALFSFEDSAIFRFLPGGRLDRSYGDGSGFARVPGNTRAIAVRPRGDVFALASNRRPNFVVHVGAGGAIDRSFGRDGAAPLPVFPKIRRHGHLRIVEFEPRSLAVAPGGGIVVGGQGGLFGRGRARVALERLDRHGRFDRSFGRGGFDSLRFGPTGECNMTELAIRPDGRIVIAGRIRRKGEDGRRAALFQLLPDGAPDPAFGEHGASWVRSRTEAIGRHLALRPDGSVLLSGRVEVRGRNAPLLLRFGRDGTLDRAFQKTEDATIRAAFARTREREAGEVLPFAGRILTVDSYYGVFAFSARGAFRASIPFEPGKKPRRTLVAGTLQRGKPLLIGQIGRERGLLLRRYLP